MSPRPVNLVKNTNSGPGSLGWGVRQRPQVRVEFVEGQGMTAHLPLWSPMLCHRHVLLLLTATGRTAENNVSASRAHGKVWRDRCTCLVQLGMPHPFPECRVHMTALLHILFPTFRRQEMPLTQETWLWCQAPTFHLAGPY